MCSSAKCVMPDGTLSVLGAGGQDTAEVGQTIRTPATGMTITAGAQGSAAHISFARGILAVGRTRPRDTTAVIGSRGEVPVATTGTALAVHAMNDATSGWPVSQTLENKQKTMKCRRVFPSSFLMQMSFSFYNWSQLERMLGYNCL